ncbi:hypothetical protein P5673_021806, partial [Acropora cervicornis]
MAVTQTTGIEQRDHQVAIKLSVEVGTLRPCVKNSTAVSPYAEFNHILPRWGPYTILMPAVIASLFTALVSGVPVLNNSPLPPWCSKTCCQNNTSSRLLYSICLVIFYTPLDPCFGKRQVTIDKKVSLALAMEKTPVWCTTGYWPITFSLDTKKKPPKSHALVLKVLSREHVKKPHFLNNQRSKEAADGNTMT